MDMGWTISGLSCRHLALHCLFIAGSLIAYTTLCPFLALPCSHWLLQCCAHITNARVASARMHVGSRRLAHISFGGRVVRADEDSHFVAEVNDNTGKSVFASFAHQEHVVDAGELEVIASAAHCTIAACRHPHRPIFSVQYHPEAVAEVLDLSLACGEMTQEVRTGYDHQRLTTNVAVAFGLNNKQNR